MTYRLLLSEEGREDEDISRQCTAPSMVVCLRIIEFIIEKSVLLRGYLGSN